MDVSFVKFLAGGWQLVQSTSYCSNDNNIIKCTKEKDKIVATYMVIARYTTVLLFKDFA